MTDTLEAALAKLPVPVAEFFIALRDSHDYSCAPLKMQMAIRFCGEKVGGLNRRISEWYLSKVFIANHGGPGVAEGHGFRRKEKRQSGTEPHIYWVMSGPGALAKFRQTVIEMTGVPIGER